MLKTVKSYSPGLIICVSIALVASFLSQNYGGPQLLYALLIGLSLHVVYDKEIFKIGIDFLRKEYSSLGGLHV
jgi:uncharacterized membrane protein YadS